SSAEYGVRVLRPPRRPFSLFLRISIQSSLRDWWIEGAIPGVKNAGLGSTTAPRQEDQYFKTSKNDRTVSGQFTGTAFRTPHWPARRPPAPRSGDSGTSGRGLR